MPTEIEDFFYCLALLRKDSRLPLRFVCDSRRIETGDVFVALKGERVNGHDFVQQALDAGAVLALVDHSYSKGPQLFNCSDPLVFIQKAAEYKLKKFKPIVIGITGSCGKTTTKHFLYALIFSSFKTFATPGNYNSQIGVPLALMALEETDKIAIIEMGMSRAGDIAKLAAWIEPDYALITAIGLAHAENFMDLDYGIARAKGEILQGAKHPLCFMNERVQRYEPFLSYTPSCLLLTTEIKRQEEGWLFKIKDIWHGPYLISCDAPHFLENIHLCLAVALALGVKESVLKKALSELSPYPGRLMHHKIAGIEFIDDSYNASPTSMKAAVEYLKSKQSVRKIAIIGAMKELGDVWLQEHRKLAYLLKEGIDQIYCLGEETQCMIDILGEKGHFFKTLGELEEGVCQSLIPQDLVLIKGSHSTQLHTLLKKLNNLLIN